MRAMQEILDELQESVNRLSTEFYESSEHLFDIKDITVEALYHYHQGRLDCRIGTGSTIKLVPVEQKR